MLAFSVSDIFCASYREAVKTAQPGYIFQQVLNLRKESGLANED